MSKELIVNAKTSQVEIALMEEGRLLELHQEKANIKVAVGDIFLGKVTRVTPSLNATFVNIGFRKEGFLHYTDTGPQIRTLTEYLGYVQTGDHNLHLMENFETLPDIDKNGNISEVFKRGQLVLVQVTKEAISTKGPRLTSEITLPGKYSVLVPFGPIISISRRIKEPEERQRLKEIAEKICPENFGLIIRTAAQDVSSEQLEEDIRLLVHTWDVTLKEVSKAKPPMKVYSELNKSFTVLRDLLSEDYEKVIVDSGFVSQQIKDFLKTINPKKTKMVDLYKGDLPIFDVYNVTKQIKMLFGKTVGLSNGAHLVVEHTEAMHVIDVNSGPKFSKSENQEENALNVNLDAADEIARQMRLRDIGGIIVIDFIDMKSSANRKMLHERMKSVMLTDRAKHTILPLSKFNIMQITRQRVRPVLHIKTTETCPTCEGTGEIESPLLLTDRIEEDVETLFGELNYQKLILIVHPFIEAFLKKGLYNQKRKWFVQYKRWVEIKADSSFHLTDYKFYSGEDGSEIILHD